MILIILNYQREIPPFMLLHMELSGKYFDKIIYITPQLYNDNSKHCKCNDLEVIQIPTNYKSISYVFEIWGIFKHGGLKNIFKAVRTRRFGWNFIKFLIAQEFCSNTLVKKTKAVIDLYGCNNAAVLATWFSISAFAAAKLKELYPDLNAVSLAHSFEVDWNKSPYIDLNFNAFKHKNINRIFFISQKIYDAYKRTVMEPLQISNGNAEVRYLGSRKLKQPLAEASTDMTFRIISCSGVISVKRVSRILETICMWKLGKIKWTHIGGGVLYEQLADMAKAVSNENIEIELLGYQSNLEVHNYYSTQQCDLFINVSEAEGIPVSLMEAISYGIPAVVTDVGGNSEIILDRATGILIPKDFSNDVLLKAMEYYYKLPYYEKQNYRNRCVSYWKDKFDLERNWSDEYKKLSGG